LREGVNDSIRLLGFVAPFVYEGAMFNGSALGGAVAGIRNGSPRRRLFWRLKAN
jgi:hypothetical protein